MYTTRYAELLEPGKLTVKETTLDYSDAELLVRVTHCGLCQYDGMFYRGILGKPPVRVGHEPAGVVEAVGRDVQGFRPGDRVTGLFANMEAFATYVTALPGQVVKIPDGVPTEQALGEPLKCIGTILRAAPPEFGDHVLVMGAGFMGLLVIAGLAGRNLGSLIAADIQPERLDLALELGATHALNPQDGDFLRQVKDITRGHGTDVAIEVTSYPEPVELAAKTLRRGRGRFVLAGWHGLPGTYTLRNWTTVGATIISAHPNYSLDPMDDMRRALDGLARGVFPMNRLITHRFPLDDIQAAFETMTTGAEHYIKGVVMP